MSEQNRRSRWRDVWQLHIPLAVVLVVCTVATAIELGRAIDGVWRAWVYTIEWPIIGLFSVWMWHRFRTEGNPVRGVTRRWQERVAKYEAEAEREAANEDPELAAWRDYQRQVRDSDTQEPRG